MITTDGTVGLADWITNDTCLVYNYISLSKCVMSHSVMTGGNFQTHSFLDIIALNFLIYV